MDCHPCYSEGYWIGLIFNCRMNFTLYMKLFIYYFLCCIIAIRLMDLCEHESRLSFDLQFVILFLNFFLFSNRCRYKSAVWLK